jgi:hypothetical protein
VSNFYQALFASFTGTHDFLQMHGLFYWKCFPFLLAPVLFTNACNIGDQALVVSINGMV